MAGGSGLGDPVSGDSVSGGSVSSASVLGASVQGGIKVTKYMFFEERRVFHYRHHRSCQINAN